jgi:hypothetical protein
MTRRAAAASIAAMKTLALILTAAAIAAAPSTASASASASAKERPEWSDCSITSLPKRYPMRKALRSGIPITYACRTAVNVLIPVRFNDRHINGFLTSDESLTAIGMAPDRDVAAGETVRTTIRIGQGWPRRVLRRVTKARLLVDIAVKRHGTRSGHFSHPRNHRFVTLRR